MAKLVLSAVLIVVLCQTWTHAAVSPNCPVSSKMQSCSPKCKDDTECFGQKCCPNICNTKSCTQPNQQSGANNGYKGSSSGATGSYCGNVKCNSFEKCELDRSTKRQKCVRA
ncbi:waprin-like protein [Atheta coriaria]|uniref:waprin-like protein n=1 Tax=Dalotia coriaria TaxID=877792 RepID=UPI0031F3F3FA